MSKTYALYRRMSPFLAKRATNLIDAMLMSNDDVGWDNDQQLIADGRVYYGTDIVKLIAHVMSPVDYDFMEPNGLKVFIESLKKIGLESEFVVNHNVKMALRTNSVSSDETDSDECNEYEDTDDEDDDDDSGSLDSTNEEHSQQSYKWKSISDTESVNESYSNSNQEDENKDDSIQESTDSEYDIKGNTNKYEWKSISDTETSINDEEEERSQV